MKDGPGAVRRGRFVVSSGTEAPGAPRCAVQLLRLGELGGEIGHDQQLGYPVAILHHLGDTAVVVEGYTHFPPVIGVDDAHFVGGSKALFGTHAGARAHQPHEALGNSKSQAGVKHHRFPRCDGDRVVGQGVQVGPGRAGGAVGGQLGPRV